MASKSLRLLAVISVILHFSPSPMAIMVSRACRTVCTGSLSFASLTKSIMVNHSMSVNRVGDWRLIRQTPTRFRTEPQLSADSRVFQPFSACVHRVGRVHRVCAQSHHDEIQSHALFLEAAYESQDTHEFEVMSHRADESVRNR